MPIELFVIAKGCDDHHLEMWLPAETVNHSKNQHLSNINMLLSQDMPTGHSDTDHIMGALNFI